MSVVDTDASYEELAGEATDAPEEPDEAPTKRKRGRPQGSKNKPKSPSSPEPVATVVRKPGRPQGSKNKPKNPPQSTEPESVTPAAPTEPVSPVAPAEPASPATPKESPTPGRAASAKTRPKPIKPVKLARSRTAGGADYDLMHYVAAATRAYGAQERLKRQDFYDRFLPIV